MRFRAARPSEASDADALIVPVFADGQAPKTLSRGVRAAVERIHREAAHKLYTATSHLAGERGLPARIVVVSAGDVAEWSVERARNVAAAGVKSLWRSKAKKAAVVIWEGCLLYTSPSPRD